MAAISWKSPVSGNWTVAADWSTGAVPTSTDDVTIAAPGSYTVTVSSNGVIVHPIGGLQADAIPFGVPDEANSLTFDAPQATLQENAGTLDVAGALTVSAGLVSRRNKRRNARVRQWRRVGRGPGRPERRRTARDCE